MPTTTLDWCERHYEPYFTKKRQGGMLASVFMVEVFLKDERVKEEIEQMKSQGYDEHKAMDAVCRQKSPICCFLGDEKVQEIYDRTEQKIFGNGKEQ